MIGKTSRECIVSIDKHQERWKNISKFVIRKRMFDFHVTRTSGVIDDDSGKLTSDDGEVDPARGKALRTTAAAW